MGPETTNNLLARIAATGAIRTGDFTLTSGQRTHWYFDSRKLSMDPQAAHIIATQTLALLRKTGITHLGAVAHGAVPIMAQAVLLSQQGNRTPLSGFIIPQAPKDHGPTDPIQGLPPPPGTHTAIIEDVVTTGNSLITAAATAQRETGAKVALTISLLARDPKAADTVRKAGFPHISILTNDDVLQLLSQRHPPSI